MDKALEQYPTLHDFKESETGTFFVSNDILIRMRAEELVMANRELKRLVHEDGLTITSEEVLDGIIFRWKTARRPIMLPVHVNYKEAS